MRARFSRFSNNGPLLIMPLVVTVFLLAYLPQQIGPGSWLSFLDGRAVSHGLPHRNVLTVLGYGKGWVDQQWLAHLTLYRLFILGGLRLVLLLHVGIFALALAIALLAARRLGGSVHATLYISFLAVLSMAGVWQLRAQSLVLPLFTGLVYLLVRDCRHPCWQVLWVWPILVLWANLHGSVALACALVVLRGLTLLRARSYAVGAMLVASPAAVFASPYAPGLFGYYRHMLVGGHLATLAVEWRPTYDFPLLALPYAALVLVTAYVLYRARRRVSLFEALALLLLEAAGVYAVRNTLWAALTALVILPALLSRSDAKAHVRWLLIAGVLLPLVAFQAVFTAAHSSSWYEAAFPPAAAHAVAAAATAHPSYVVLTDTPYSDWLLFTQPRLAGRVVYDTSIEFLTLPELKQVDTWLNGRPGWQRAVPPQAILVLDRSRLCGRLPWIVAHGQRIYSDKQLLVFLLR